MNQDTMQQDPDEGTTPQTEQGARERFNALEQQVRDMQQQLRLSQAIIDQQSGMIQQLSAQVNAPSTSTTTVDPSVVNLPAVHNIALPERQIGETIKPPHPEKFNGDPYKIQKYFLDIRTHFDYYFPITFAPHKIVERVQYAGTRLEGAAAEWFDPILKDYRNNAEDKRTQTTTEVFAKYENYEDNLKSMFGEANEQQNAERKLREMKQLGALSKYTVSFIQLLTKVDWTEESKKDVYYYSLKSEVKDELYKVDRSKETFSQFTQKAIDIDNRQWERKQERKQEKSGTPHRHIPNQGKKRQEYVASSNDGKPGRMDLDTINSKKFLGTCNFCGKKGHKENDCYKKKPQEGCNFCGRKGHKEEDCYKKKGIKPWENKEKQLVLAKTQIDTIQEVPHNSLSWTACYDDSCATHKNSKDGSGWYPRKPRQKKNVRIDTLNFYEQPDDNEYGNDGVSDQDLSQLAEHIEDQVMTSNMLTQLKEEDQDRSIVWSQNSDLDSICEYCGSTEPTWIHHCNEEEHANEERRIREFELNRTGGCRQCGSRWPNHSCPGCRTCGSRQQGHNCTKEQQIIDKICQKEEWKFDRNEDKIYSKIWGGEHKKQATYHPTKDGKAERHICNPTMTTQQFLEWEETQFNLDPYRMNQDCGQEEWDQCKEKYCGKHLYDKLDEWHMNNQDCGQQRLSRCDNWHCQKHLYYKVEEWHITTDEVKREQKNCNQNHFLSCNKNSCPAHKKEKYQLYKITRFLAQRGYDLETHVDHGHGNKTAIKKYHRMIQGRNEDIHCKWCLKYYIPKGEETLELRNISIDSIGGITKKLLVTGLLAQRSVRIYVDSGSDRNLISEDLVAELRLPRIAKLRPLVVSSIANEDTGRIINEETDHLPFTIANRTGTLQFDIMELHDCDMLLGHPWLETANPTINWRTKEIRWDSEPDQE
jgi:Retrotransposon gag protein